jgi:hypothetical protein
VPDVADGEENTMIVPAVIVILAGLGLIWLAVASWQERLPRNGLAGVRTPATMRSDQAFKVANKVAAPLTASRARSKVSAPADKHFFTQRQYPAGHACAGSVIQARNSGHACWCPPAAAGTAG